MGTVTLAVSASSQATVYALATTLDGTRATLAAAVPLARGSSARLQLLVPQVVPYPLPLEAPAESISFVAERYRSLLRQLEAEADVRLCLCRRPDDVLRMLPAHATVVVGGPAGTWRAQREERLAWRLTHLGHHVVFAPIEEHAGAKESSPSGGARPVPSAW
jgi:hypothetical protein